MRTFYILIPKISSNHHRGPPSPKKLYKIIIHLQILTACNYFLLPIKDVTEQWDSTLGTFKAAQKFLPNVTVAVFYF